MALSRLYLTFLGLLLLGYVFLDKGFAYIGYAPVYLGELALVAGIFVLVGGGVSVHLFRSPIVWAILAFALWSALTTLPYLGTYGIVAFRDSALWGYSAFALLVAGVLLRAGFLERSLDWYGRWLPWFLLWAPIGFLLYSHFSEVIPYVPGSHVRLLTLKAGDFGVHLAGAAVFLALGLHQQFPRRSTTWLQLKEWSWWLLWSAGLVVTGAKSRSALLTVFTVLVLLMVMRATSRVQKIVLSGVIIASLLVAFDVSIPLSYEDIHSSSVREVSAEQIFNNFHSIFFEDSVRGLAGTRSWRLDWWKEIMNYTVFGEYFWTGKGYGIDLAKSDGFRGHSVGLRSPHNGHVTILARSGVPGIALWLIVQGTIFITLLRAFLQARRTRQPMLASVNLWILAYWTAFNVNATFDVYLEGPQGGVWYWSLIGFAVALTELQRRTVARPLEPQRQPSLAA